MVIFPCFISHFREHFIERGDRWPFLSLLTAEVQVHFRWHIFFLVAIVDVFASGYRNYVPSGIFLFHPLIMCEGRHYCLWRLVASAGWAIIGFTLIIESFGFRPNIHSNQVTLSRPEHGKYVNIYKISDHRVTQVYAWYWLVITEYEGIQWFSCSLIYNCWIRDKVSYIWTLYVFSFNSKIPIKVLVKPMNNNRLVIMKGCCFGIITSYFPWFVNSAKYTAKVLREILFYLFHTSIEKPLWSLKTYSTCYQDIKPIYHFCAFWGNLG